MNIETKRPLVPVAWRPAAPAAQRRAAAGHRGSAVSVPPVYRPAKPQPIQRQVSAAGRSRPGAVVQRAWSKPLFASTSKTKTLTDDDFPDLSPSSSSSARPAISLSVPSEFAKWQDKPVEQKAQAPVDALKGIKDKILAWNRTSHDGVKLALTESQISTLTTWAEAVTSNSGVSKVFTTLRGEGSGSYAGSDQLKIIARFSPKILDKQPTYHITLKD